MSSFGATGTDVLGVGLQPSFAQEFFELVTGHSLGGSLAGYIGSLSGVGTVSFNEIP